MIRLKRGAERPLHAVDLRRGVILHARGLDSFALSEIAAEVEAEWEALVIGAPLRDWGVSPETIELASTLLSLKQILKGWMIAVLTAARAVDRIDGVEDESGAPATPSFEVFALLFVDSDFEMHWRRGSARIGQLWAAEGNVSGRGLNGVSTAATTSAKAAEISTQLAPVDVQSKTSTETNVSVLSLNTPPAPAPAPSPGA